MAPTQYLLTYSILSIPLYEENVSFIDISERKPGFPSKCNVAQDFSFWTPAWSSLANNNEIEGNGGRPPVISKLKGLYCHKILPLERHYLFDKFHSPPLSEADFEANPMILMIGQYSTGKSSMIRYLDLEHIPHVCPNNLGTYFINQKIIILSIISIIEDIYLGT